MSKKEIPFLCSSLNKLREKAKPLPKKIREQLSKEKEPSLRESKIAQMDTTSLKVEV